MTIDLNAPLCAIRAFKENGRFYFEPYRTFDDQDEMDDFHDQLEETGSPEGELITCMAAPWPRVKDFYPQMYLLLEHDIHDSHPDSYRIVDCFRTLNNMVNYLVQQQFGVFVCDNNDFDAFKEGNPVYSGKDGHITIPLNEQDDTCDLMFSWVIATPK